MTTTRHTEHAPQSSRRGRPLWKIPKRFVIERPYFPGEWSKLDSAAQTILPVLEIFSEGTQSDAGLDLLAKCSGSRGTVVAGLNQLKEAGLIDRERRKNLHGGWTRCKTRFAPRLSCDIRETHGRFFNEVVTGGAWFALSPVARAVYVVLLCGVQHERYRKWVLKLPFCAGYAESGTREVPAPRQWLDKDRHFSWHHFHSAMLADKKDQRYWRNALPCLSFTKYDKGNIGLKKLAALAGRTKDAVRDAIEQLEALQLVLCLNPSHAQRDSRRFVLPHCINWMQSPDFLPPKPRYTAHPEPTWTPYINPDETAESPFENGVEDFKFERDFAGAEK